jgi:hypothetical protein
MNGNPGMSIAVLSILSAAVSITSQPLEPTSQIQVINRNANYGGVSFKYDSLLASKVVGETVREWVHDKPSDVIPEHPSFTLVDYPLFKNSPQGNPQIKVFSLNKFRRAMRAASTEGNKHVVYPRNPPSWTTYFDEEVRILKSLLAGKPARDVQRFVAKARGHEGCSAAMPFLPMREACQAFVARVRYVNFKNGKGVFFLTQWDRETTQINNQWLECAFQGITDDGRYWVYAEFPVAAPFLPRGDEPEIVAWNEQNYLLAHESKEYQAYLRPVRAKLEALPAKQFQPNLELLEKLIGSLEVKIK